VLSLVVLIIVEVVDIDWNNSGFSGKVYLFGAY